MLSSFTKKQKRPGLDVAKTNVSLFCWKNNWQISARLNLTRNILNADSRMAQKLPYLRRKNDIFICIFSITSI